MANVKTIAVEDGNSYKIINESDFDEKTMKKYGGVLPRDTVTDLTNRNADGTFSEPTPTDVRYPNMDNTEFANNHGAHVNRSAAEIRKEKDLPDAPGGLNPDPVLAEVVEADKKAREEAAKAEAKKVEAEAKKAAEDDKSSAKK